MAETMKPKADTIVWSSTFSCGIKIIDDQHKHLIDVVNDLINHVPGTDEEEAAYVSKVFKDVITYVKVHFDTEEKIMKTTEYAGYAEHKAAHDNFILTVAGFMKNISAGNRLTLMTISKYLRDWILSHVGVMDKQYFDYFMKDAVRKKVENLKLPAQDMEN